MKHAFLAGCAALFWAASALAQTPQAEPAARGAMLYNNHCIECHTQQMHWRAHSKVSDWNSLKAQVRRWQGAAGLGWSEADIEEVTRHLNDTIYRLPRTVAQAK